MTFATRSLNWIEKKNSVKNYTFVYTWIANYIWKFNGSFVWYLAIDNSYTFDKILISNSVITDTVCPCTYI